MNDPVYKLFMLILGCKPPGRNTEQHDVFFGIGTSLKDLLPAIQAFWKNAGTIHIDSYREINVVDDYHITIVKEKRKTVNKLFFLNLGGYKAGDMEEYHYKVLTVASNKGDAIKQAKQTAFYKHVGFKEAASHIDDKYGIDVDDIYEINDILDSATKLQFSIHIEKAIEPIPADPLKIGYLKLDKIKT